MLLIITSAWWDQGWLSSLILFLCIFQVSRDEHILFNNDNIKLILKNQTKMEEYSCKGLLEKVTKL